MEECVVAITMPLGVALAATMGRAIKAPAGTARAATPIRPRVSSFFIVTFLVRGRLPVDLDPV